MAKKQILRCKRCIREAKYRMKGEILCSECLGYKIKHEGYSGYEFVDKEERKMLIKEDENNY